MKIKRNKRSRSELFITDYSTPDKSTYMNKCDKLNYIIMYVSHQLGARYEGQLMSEGGAYSPFHSILLVLTHDFIIIYVYGPTGSDGHEWMVPTRTLVAHHFLAV